MITDVRCYIGKRLISLGVAILPSEVRRLVRGILMYHVPNALSESEKAYVREAAHNQ